VEVFRTAVVLMVRSMVLSAQSSGQQRLPWLQQSPAVRGNVADRQRRLSPARSPFRRLGASRSRSRLSRHDRGFVTTYTGVCHRSLRRRFVAGAVFVPDSYSERPPSVAARWAYGPGKRGVGEMRRIGLAA